MLLTVIDGNEDFKDRILQDPIYLYFTPLQQVPFILDEKSFCIKILRPHRYFIFIMLLCNVHMQALDFSNETCVYWNPVQK